MLRSILLDKGLVSGCAIVPYKVSPMYSVTISFSLKNDACLKLSYTLIKLVAVNWDLMVD
jgi:hypothetical protein